MPRHSARVRAPTATADRPHRCPRARPEHRARRLDGPDPNLNTEFLNVVSDGILHAEAMKRIQLIAVTAVAAATLAGGAVAFAGGNGSGAASRLDDGKDLAGQAQI